jgi:hypothetical protein
LIRTAWKAMKSDERKPKNKERLEGAAFAGTVADGATPTKKPAATTIAAITTRVEGLERVCTEDTRMVRGRTRPRAIYEVKMAVFKL